MSSKGVKTAETPCLACFKFLRTVIARCCMPRSLKCNPFGRSSPAAWAALIAQGFLCCKGFRFHLAAGSRNCRGRIIGVVMRRARLRVESSEQWVHPVARRAARTRRLSTCCFYICLPTALRIPSSCDWVPGAVSQRPKCCSILFKIPDSYHACPRKLSMAAAGN